MNIGGVEILGKAVLAPMAGVADNAFRLMAKEGGADLVFTELISADGLVRQNPKTFRLLRFLPEERPIGIQLFGSDPGIMAEAAHVVEEAAPDFIDLNFGCPAKKVVGRGAGSALLNDLPRMKAIIKAVVGETRLPVTGKIRSGWDANAVVAVEVAKILEGEGACCVTVHARTRKMGFKGQADWGVIGDVKKAVSIPIIGNGDIVTVEDGARMIDVSGCDLVMIGRGAMGRPWIFRQMNRFLATGEKPEEPSCRERLEICLRHYDLALSMLGEQRGVKEIRKHIGWYLKGMPNSSRIKAAVFTMTDPDEVKETLKAYSEQLPV